MTRDNAFGPDFDKEPGLTPVPSHAAPPQLTDFQVESCAIHSESQGWLPGITLKFLADDGVGMTFMMFVGPEVIQIAEDMTVCAARAVGDWRAAGLDQS